MTRASQVLVILVVALAIAKPFSLPPAKFLKDFALKYQRSSIVMSIPKEISRNQVVKRYITMYKACPFEFGLIKFALDPVGEFFFKKCQKNYMCLSDPMVVNFFEMHLIQHFFFGNDFFFHFKKNYNCAIRAPLLSHQNQLKTVQKHVNFPVFGITAFELLLFGYKQLIVITFYVYYLQEKICWCIFTCF